MGQESDKAAYPAFPGLTHHGINKRINCRERPHLHLGPVSSPFTCSGYMHSYCAKCGFVYIASDVLCDEEL